MTTKDEALALALEGFQRIAEQHLEWSNATLAASVARQFVKTIQEALDEPTATPDVPEVDFGNTSPQGSMSFYVGGKLAHTVGNPVMSFAVSHEPSAWAAAIDTSGQRVEEAADGGHEAAQQQAPAWIPVEHQMPEPNRKVLAFHKNILSNGRTICARWVKAKTVESTGDSEIGEYDEATDTYYDPEGWYECIENWDDYNRVFVSHQITHWMPLPPAPTQEGGAA